MEIWRDGDRNIGEVKGQCGGGLFLCWGEQVQPTAGLNSVLQFQVAVLHQRADRDFARGCSEQSCAAPQEKKKLML